MQELTCKASVLKNYSKEIFCKLGCKDEDAEIISNILAETDLRGISSHGVARIPIYVERIKLGLINLNPQIKQIKENETSALLDADNGMGQVVSHKAMELCIQKAKKYGTGVVGVRGSNHFGINAYYTMMASKEKMIGLAFTNTSPLMAPFGGRERLLGSNPLSIAIPAGEEPDLVVDMATSVVARGKLEVIARKGGNIPEGWAIDPEGKATVDPQKGLAGALLPFSGPKGYGLALIVDILSGVLTGSKFGPDVGSLFGNMDKTQDIGHFFMAINIENFMEINQFVQRMDEMIANIRNSQKAVGFDRIYMPGEIEFEKTKELEQKGITINEKVLTEINQIANDLNMELLEEYLIKEEVAATQ